MSLKLTDLQAAYQTLANAQRVLLVAHQKPDGDTSGSALALQHWIRSLGKEAALFCLNPIPDQYHYVPGAADLITDPVVFDSEWDVVITCDSGDLTYAGVSEYMKRLSKKPVIINFDHHVSNTFFGDINLVDVQASSTAEVVYAFFDLNKIEISKEVATCLMTGVFTDTGGFSNAATNERSLEIAAEFVKKGASVRQVYDAVIANKHLSVLKLWGKVLNRLKQTERGIAYTYVLRKDFLEHGVDDEAIDGLSNYLSNLKDIKAVIVLVERESGKVKVSMRTYRNDVDLAQLAGAFGGGGHKKAAGFTLNGRILEHEGMIKVASA